jgi:hypothetical protein
MLPESIILGILFVSLFGAVTFALALGGAQRRPSKHGFRGPRSLAPSSGGRRG